MEHHANNPITSFVFTLISVSTGLFASIIANVEILTRLGAAFVAMLSGVMAIRHYYYSTKKIQKELKG